MKSHDLTLLTGGVGGVPTRILMNVFVVAMGLGFVSEVAFHVLGLFGLGEDITFLTILVATEIPLWFAQVFLWERGEVMFERNERRLIEAVQTLKSLGFAVEFMEPALVALFSTKANLSETEAEAVRAVQFASAKAYMLGLKRTVVHADHETVGAVLAEYEEAREQWLESVAASLKTR